MSGEERSDEWKVARYVGRRYNALLSLRSSLPHLHRQIISKPGVATSDNDNKFSVIRSERGGAIRPVVNESSHLDVDFIRDNDGKVQKDQKNCTDWAYETEPRPKDNVNYSSQYRLMNDIVEYLNWSRRGKRIRIHRQWGGFVGSPIRGTGPTR